METLPPAPARPLAGGLEDLRHLSPEAHGDPAPSPGTTSFTGLKDPSDTPRQHLPRRPHRPPRHPPPPPSPRPWTYSAEPLGEVCHHPSRKSQRPFDLPRHDVCAGGLEDPSTTSAAPAAEVSECASAYPRQWSRETLSRLRDNP